MKEIELTQGMVALVDDEDYERVSQYNWFAEQRGHTWYAQRHSPRPEKKKIYLHRFIMDAPDGVQVDHKSRNGLDCRRDNLRLATHSQNKQNTGLLSNNASGFIGVTWHSGAGKWSAQIQVESEQIYLGLFTDKVEAAKARDVASIKYFKEFAVLNFPLG